ncbi:MAG: glycosyltransferase family 1 protein [Campylobacterota bacterium]|nr:glycosyltransferase family 1 protein [Campylobacterota bacterium]
MKKILFDARVLNHKFYTGVENYTKNILENLLQATNYPLQTIKAQPKTKNKYLSHLWLHFVLPFKKADILFCPANIAPVFIPKNKKLVLTLHDVAFLTQEESFSTIFRLYYKFVIPFNIKRADKIITVSNYSKSQIIEHFPYASEKIEVVHIAASEIFKPIENIKKENTILYVGSLNKRKNFTSIIKAFNRLIKDQKTTRYPLLATHLKIVGNFSDNFQLDQETQQLLEDAKKNKNIIFCQNVDDEELLKLYNSSKLFIFPSFYEGFGLPVLEAMSCGTPVICSNTTSLPEVGGEAVLYCNPHDINDIAQKLKQVLCDENLQNTMIKEGITQAKNFNWQITTKKHIKTITTNY